MKKQNEREVLAAIYSARSGFAIVDSESPDFLVTRGDEQTVLGIEVTEYYDSESDARLANIPGYGTEILTDGRYRHKDDMVALPVESVVYRSHKGPTDGRTIRAIVMRGPTLESSSKRFISLVREKAEKCRTYLHKAPQIDLIVRDRQNAFAHHRLPDLIRLLVSNCTNDICDSPFREIFLITRREGASVYSPLRTVVFASKVHLYEQLLQEGMRTGTKLRVSQYIAMLCGGLNASGFGSARVAVGPEQIKLTFASVDFTLTTTGKRTYTAKEYDAPSEAPGDRLSELVETLDAAEQDMVRKLVERSTDISAQVEIILPTN